MYEFGEEFVIESYQVPWLIWIQLLVMILLIILLVFGFTIFSLDPPASSQSTNNTAAASSSSTSRQTHINNSSSLHNVNGSSRNPTVEEIRNVKGNAGSSTSREITAEQIQVREGSATKDVSFRPFQQPEHPCHYFGLAKKAFLKCLGLDSSSQSSTDRKEHMKND